MYHYQYHLVNAIARNAIDLGFHEAEIRRAFRYVKFLPNNLTVHGDHFEFVTRDELSAGDLRQMGHQIARSAKLLAAEAARVYEAVPESNRLKSTQLFKRIRP